jgi:hypothetical protein
MGLEHLQPIPMSTRRLEARLIATHSHAWCGVACRVTCRPQPTQAVSSSLKRQGEPTLLKRLTSASVGTQPARCASRKMCVSTARSGRCMLKSSIQLMVLGPTPLNLGGRGQQVTMRDSKRQHVTMGDMSRSKQQLEQLAAGCSHRVTYKGKNRGSMNQPVR